ncbi:MAG: sulfite exporter TauE/SafE family protein [Candidatus Omnitrophica bacterium]|nr:sulfite exporter TauE/SafE family protein [Candidatus Omnitrophota bacterium]
MVKYIVMAIMDLFNVQRQSSIYATCLMAYLLGIIHGITPDEHTWPITFSYSIGSYSAKRGFIIGLAFSLAFTLQRAIASELAYFSLIKFLTIPSVEYIVYAIVGIAMALGGIYVFRFNDIFHIHLGRIDRLHHKEVCEGLECQPHKTSVKMALLHGFIAGWGFGAFAFILYAVLSPSMPDAWTGWIPGFLFGLGTTTVQMFAGASFGWLSRSLKMPQETTQKIANLTAGRTLFYGGLLFIIAGITGLIDPGLMSFNIKTSINVHNLHNLGLGFFLVIFIVLFIGLFTLVRETVRYHYTLDNNK